MGTPYLLPSRFAPVSNSNGTKKYISTITVKRRGIIILCRQLLASGGYFDTIVLLSYEIERVLSSKPMATK